MSFWGIVNNVIEKSDVLILVIDPRFPESSRNNEIEDKIRRKNKKIIFVVNKADLLDIKEMEKIKKIFKKIGPTVFISSTKHLGTTLLKKEIMKQVKGEKSIVGILGYPNTGKSSLINALKGRKATKTSSMSGYTTGTQLVRISQKIVLYDTPGVYSYDKKDKEKLFLFNAIDHTKVKNAEMLALSLIEKFDKIKKHYEVKEKDPEIALEKIAIKLNKFKKGGIPDTEKAARDILRDWQHNKIK